MKKFVFLISLLLLLVACQKEEQVIVKKTTPKNTKENPELIEQSNKNEDEVDEMIEFILPNEKVMINLEMVPILNAYLSAAHDPIRAVESMHLTPIHYDNSQLYLLEFSCVNETCSYLLLDKSDGNQAYLVADLALSKEIKLSPDNSKIFLQFNRDNLMALPLSNMIVIDIEEWELLPLTNITNEMDILDYQWPILAAEWIDNQSISVKIPDIVEPSSSLLSKWNEVKEATQEIILTID
ncbi:hypothetical protein LG329_18820 [Virgibacillus necropolis]|uniref:hypothetical protein n=1 Tax=Virgibacillus necropolis TaxID=163877 RepID=UPI003850C552